MYHYSLQQFKKKKKSNLGEGENLISMGNIIVKCPISKKKKITRNSKQWESIGHSKE